MVDYIILNTLDLLVNFVAWVMSVFDYDLYHKESLCI